MSELARRVGFGVPAAGLFLWLMWLGGRPYESLLALIAVMILLEMSRMFKKMERAPYLLVSLLIAGFLWQADALPPGVLAAGSYLLLFAALAPIPFAAGWLPPRGAVRSSSETAGRTSGLADRWVATLVCGIYGPLGMLLFHRIRLTGPDEAGFWLALATILMIWGNDVFAYFGGRKFGKRPLAPRISPNKTWEGFWSGFAGSLAGLLIAWALAGASFPVPLAAALPVVVVAGSAGPAGDLLESRLKRLSGLKDSSRILPGHGGFFDRFDALIFSAPLIYLYLNLLV